MPSVSSWILLARETPTIYWGSTGVMLGAGIRSPWARTKGIQMVSFGARATANVTWASFRALAGTTLVRGGTTTLGSLAVAAAGGYVIGSAVGTGIAYAGWGEKGASDALDFYSGRVSADQYFSTVGSALFR